MADYTLINKLIGKLLLIDCRHNIYIAKENARKTTVTGRDTLAPPTQDLLIQSKGIVTDGQH
jgi:hypothetical protein